MHLAFPPWKSLHIQRMQFKSAIVTKIKEITISKQKSGELMIEKKKSFPHIQNKVDESKS